MEFPLNTTSLGSGVKGISYFWCGEMLFHVTLNLSLCRFATNLLFYMHQSFIFSLTISHAIHDEGWGWEWQTIIWTTFVLLCYYLREETYDADDDVWLKFKNHVSSWDISDEAHTHVM